MMNSNGKTLVLIPARGGSKGIPQKNVSLINGKPLIYYAIANALKVPESEAFVATDDEKIEAISSVFGIDVIKRPLETATDEATIDDVVNFCLGHLASSLGRSYSTVVTLQPTSPLLRIQTLLDALQDFQRKNVDTLISTTPQKHLSWKRNCRGFLPLYEERVNRQQLEPIYVENGAFVICRAATIHERRSRIGESVDVFPLPEDEGIDIDNRTDWVLAETILKRKNVALVADGNHRLGMGHIYRALTLGSRLVDHNVHFYTHENSDLGNAKFYDLNYRFQSYRDQEHLFELLAADHIDIVINDILDTTANYVDRLRASGYFVVNFEDTGTGATECDILFNALYEWSGNNQNAFFGYRYECLRDDIYLYPFKTQLPEKVRNILVAFGGTDINNATQKILELLDSNLFPDVTFTVILGIGYKYEETLRRFLKESSIGKSVRVLNDIKLMSKYLNEADIVISGNGRMVYEAVAIGTPLIVCSQNDRESSHTFAKVCPGVVYLGNIANLDTATALKEIYTVYRDSNRRQNLNRHLRPYAEDIRNGIDRITSILWDAYKRRITNEASKSLS